MTNLALTPGVHGSQEFCGFLPLPFPVPASGGPNKVFHGAP